MRRHTAPLALIALLLAPVLPASAAQAPVSSADSASRPATLDPAGRFIVVLDEGTNAKTVRDRHANMNGVKTDQLFQHAVKGFAGRLTAGQVAALKKDPDVAAVVPDEVIELAGQVVPNGVWRVGANVSTMARIDGVDQRVDADVAIVDTGIDRNHDDLNVVGGYNCSTSDRSAWRDVQSHGTHVAGTVAALDNGIGVVGVAPGARLWAVKILNDDGFGYLSWYVCGLDWIASRLDPLDKSRPLIESVNMSVAKWGSDDRSCGKDNNDVLHQAICRVTSAGIPVVAAAANDAGSAAARVPAAYDEVITVSALADTDGEPGGLGGNSCYSWGTYDRDDTFADFSNYGSDVDIIAPGKCIWSTLPGQRYGYSSGTSMAAPAVAGAVALYRATRPWVGPMNTKRALQYLANDGWFTSSDPDNTHERLLDVSRVGPAGDFSVAVASPKAVDDRGGTQQLAVTLNRTKTHFEQVSLAVEAPAGITATVADRSLMGFLATSTTLNVTVPADTATGRYPIKVTATEATRVRTATVDVVVQNDPPVALPPVVRLLPGRTMGTTTGPVVIDWPVAKDASGVAGYEVQQSVDGGPWGPATRVSASTTSLARQVELGHTHRYQVRAVDFLGNWGPWAAGPAFDLGVADDRSTSFRYGAGWVRAESRAAYSRTLTVSKVPGASATLTTSSRNLGLVAPVGPTRGDVTILVDGQVQATVSLRADVGSSRRLVWSGSWATEATRTIELRVVGNPDGPRFDVDAILIGR
jgi:subtilisin family serine protease